MRVLVLCLALAACSPQLPPNIGSPVAYANRTVVDEQAAVALETGYKLWRAVVEYGVDSGMIKGERAKRVAAVDRTIYGSLLVARQAYQTGNAADFVAAIRSANAALAQGHAIVKGR